MRTALFPLAAVLALAACDSSTPDEAAPDAAPEGAVDNRPVPPDDAESATAETYATTDIPAAMQGRWGLVAADCEPGRDDAKGLMAVNPRDLEFYESVGTLDRITDRAGNRIRADFDFSGEGMTWRRDMALELGNGGATLVRREYGEDAAPDPLSYSKCG